MKKRIAVISLLILFIFSASVYFATRAQGQGTLTVSSDYSLPSPSGGSFDNGTEITASVTSPWPGGFGIQYICTGWFGNGTVGARLLTKGRRS